MKNTRSVTDPNRHFHTDHLKADIKGRSVRGGAVTMVAQICKFILQMGSTIVLARLLTPQDYGLVGMVTAVTGFIGSLKDMGLSMATVQRAEINHRQVSTLLWVNVALSLALAVVTAALAPVIAWFYGEPRLSLMTLVLASGYIFGGLSVQHQALLNRQMRFTSLAIIDITSMLSGIAIAIVLAWYETGVWALIFMQLATGITYTIGVWWICSWRPGPPVRYSGIRSMLAFGGNLTGFNLINYLARNLDNVLIGRYWGAQQLGLYAKAYQLLLLPLQQINAPITAVAIPGLSRLRQDPQTFARYYLKALSFIAFLTMPVGILLLVISEEIVALILGSQWHEAAVIFRLLGLSALVQPICNTTGWLHISAGRTDRMLKWGIFAASFIVMSFFIGLPHGASGVALCYAVVQLLLAWPCLYYATRGTSITVRNLLDAVKQPFLASLVAGTASLGVKIAIGSILPILTTALICFIVMTLVYFIVMFYVFNTKAFYQAVISEFKQR